MGKVLAGDDKERIRLEIENWMEKGADMVRVSGGMSVDPDDRTPAAIRACGGEVITYGTPVLPGAMFMLSYVQGIPVIGLPGCVMYSKRTVFDLAVPRILAGGPADTHGFCKNGPWRSVPELSGLRVSGLRIRRVRTGKNRKMVRRKGRILMGIVRAVCISKERGTGEKTDTKGAFHRKFWDRRGCPCRKLASAGQSAFP